VLQGVGAGATIGTQDRRLATTESVTTCLSSHDAQEIRTPLQRDQRHRQGPTGLHWLHQALGGDIDTFEEKLIALLTHGA